MCRSTCSTSPGGPSSTGWVRWPGTFDLDLAHAVAAPDADDRLLTVDLVTELIDRSLVVAEATATRTRYRLLELVRDHARDALRAEGRWDDANERLTEVLASEADAILRDGVTSWSAELISRVIENVGNLSTALDWCIAHDARPRPRGAPLPPPLRRRPPEPLGGGAGPRGSASWSAGPPTPAPLRAEALAVLATAYAVGGRSAERCSELAHQALADPDLTADRGGGRPPCPHHRGHRRGRRRSVRSSTPRPDEQSRAPRGLHPFERELAGFEASLLDRDGHPDEADALARRGGRGVRRRRRSDHRDLGPSGHRHRRHARPVASMRLARAIDQAQATSHAIQGVWWGGAIFRSQALLASYEATAVGSDDGWEASRELWRRAIEQARSSWRPARARPHLEAGGRGRRRGPTTSTTAHALLDAVPPTPEVTVLPELFEEERVDARGRAARRSRRGLVRASSSRFVTPSARSARPTWPSQTAASAAPEVRPATAGAGGRRVGRSLGGSTVRVRDSRACATSRCSSPGPGRRSTASSSWAPPTSAAAAPGPALDDAPVVEYQARILELQDDIDEAQRRPTTPPGPRRPSSSSTLLVQRAEQGLRSRRPGPQRRVERGEGPHRGHLPDPGDHQEGRRAARGPRPHLTHSVRTGTWCAYRPETSRCAGWSTAGLTSRREARPHANGVSGR